MTSNRSEIFFLLNFGLKVWHLEQDSVFMRYCYFDSFWKVTSLYAYVDRVSSNHSTYSISPEIRGYKYVLITFLKLFFCCLAIPKFETEPAT